MPSLEELLGAHVVNAKGEKVPSASLAQNDCIGLYFSAHWCGPCRQFTPMLIASYNKLKAAGKKFEVVFVSGDHGEKQFNEYFGSMPWLAVPFADREAEAKLSGAFEVEGIPTLVLLNNKGETITRDGRSRIANDPEGANFPWLPKPLFDLLPAEVLRSAAGDKVPLADVRKNDVVGLYFSAHWCPPCRGFTPELAATYKKLKAANKKFEIIFVSSDRSPEQFREYFASMPWLALPFEDRALKAALSEKFEVEGIPTLVLVEGATGKEISRDGREEVAADPEGAKFPWMPAPPQALEALTPKLVDTLNKRPCFLFLLESLSPEDLAKKLDVIRPVAQKHFHGDETKLRFIYTDARAAPIAASIRQFLGGVTDATTAVILNIPGRSKAPFAGPIDEASVAAAADNFVSGKLALVPLR